MVSYKSISKKLERSQPTMERKMLNVKLKDRIRNIIIRQRTKVTDIVKYVTNAKWKTLWVGHIARMKIYKWTITLEAQSGRWRAKDHLEDQNVAGEMTLWGNGERYGQG